ncbi:MAG: ABC transporter permease [Gammaproteobacteria bacterium]
MAYNIWKVNKIALWGLFTKETRRFFRIWPQTLLPPVVNMGLYFIIFGQWLGSNLGLIQGQPYVAYLIPGLIFLSMITNAYANVVSSFFLAKFQRQIEELLVASLEDASILLGYVFGGALRGMIVAGLVLVFSRLFFAWQIQHVFSFIAIVLISVLIFALAGFINGMYAKKFDDINIVPTFILGPLTYLGGVFYDVNTLPEQWRLICHLNPIYHMVNALRWAFLGQGFDCNIQWVIISMLAGLTLLFLWAYKLLRKGLGLRF